MKKSMKYTVLTVPNKLKVDIKLITDDLVPSEFVSLNKDVMSLSLYPLISVSIVRPFEIDENGIKKRPPWNPNDSLAMTKYTLPIFLKELVDINEDIKIKEMYNYFNDRLELNEELGQKVTRKFKIGNNSVELRPTVISMIDDTRIEGIKLKINNEDSVVLLSLNDVEALIYTLKNCSVDMIAFLLYNRYMKGSVNHNDRNSGGDKQNIFGS